MLTSFAFTATLLIGSVAGKFYFKENFNDKDWEKRWVVAKDWKPKVKTTSHCDRIGLFASNKLFMFMTERTW